LDPDVRVGSDAAVVEPDPDDRVGSDGVWVCRLGVDVDGDGQPSWKPTRLGGPFREDVSKLTPSGTRRASCPSRPFRPGYGRTRLEDPVRTQTLHVGFGRSPVARTFSG
jgi:hypothetical protein